MHEQHRGRAGAALALAKKCCPDLRGFVFQREIHVPGGGSRKVGDLAFNPKPRQTLLEQSLGLTIELTDCYRGREGIRLARIFHAREYIGPCPAFAEIFMRVQWSV